MFVLMPLIIWIFDTSVSSEISYARFLRHAFSASGASGRARSKLVALALIWAYLHHFTAGVRHLWMDVNHKAVSKTWGGSSAKFTLVFSIRARRSSWAPSCSACIESPKRRNNKWQ